MLLQNIVKKNNKMEAAVLGTPVWKRFPQIKYALPTPPNKGVNVPADAYLEYRWRYSHTKRRPSEPFLDGRPSCDRRMFPLGSPAG
jgi:hypothetical protein